MTQTVNQFTSSRLNFLLFTLCMCFQFGSLSASSNYAKELIDDNLPKGKKEVRIVEYKGSLFLTNRLKDEVEIMILKDNSFLECIAIAPGDYAYYQPDYFQKGKYSFFISGRYNELIKLVSWDKERGHSN